MNVHFSHSATCTAVRARPSVVRRAQTSHVCPSSPRLSDACPLHARPTLRVLYRNACTSARQIRVRLRPSHTHRRRTGHGADGARRPAALSGAGAGFASRPRAADPAHRRPGFNLPCPRAALAQAAAAHPPIRPTRRRRRREPGQLRGATSSRRWGPAARRRGS